MTVDGGATVAVDIFNSTGGVDYSGVGADLASLQIAAGATASFTQMILGLTGGAVDGVLKLQTSATVNSVDGPLTIGHGAKLTSAASMVTNFFIDVAKQEGDGSLTVDAGGSVVVKVELILRRRPFRAPARLSPSATAVPTEAKSTSPMT